MSDHAAQHRRTAARSNGQLPLRLEKIVAAALAREPVVAAYLHGSHARGQADADSDLDLALLADGALCRADCLELRLRVTEKLQDRLQDTIDPDVVVLQQAPVLLQYNVVRNGIVVLGRDAPERRAFELDVEQRYDDERPYLDRETDIILERILSLRP